MAVRFARHKFSHCPLSDRDPIRVGEMIPGEGRGCFDLSYFIADGK